MMNVYYRKVSFSEFNSIFIMLSLRSGNSMLARYMLRLSIRLSTCRLSVTSRVFHR